MAYDLHSRPPRRWLLPTAALLIGLLIAALAWTLLNPTGPTKSEPAAPPSPNRTASSSSVCGLPEGQPAVPRKAPAAEWRLEDGFAYPTSSTFGPGREQGNVHFCYSHNPTGALFAAVGYGADGENVDADLDQQLERVFDDAGKDDVVRGAQAAGKADRGSIQALEGYRFADVTPDRVVLDLAFQVTEGPKMGGLASLEITMAWQKGDWRYVAPPGGPSSKQVTSLRGFTSWKAS